VPVGSAAPSSPPPSVNDPAKHLTRHLPVGRGSGWSHHWTFTKASPPPEVWGTGLTSQAWRTQDVSNLNSLKLTALSNFQLLRSNLHARKDKERAIRLSPHIAQREVNIAGANKHLGIQSLHNELLHSPKSLLNNMFLDRLSLRRRPRQIFKLT